ncbi:MAG: MotA/TolQ/ExbB proton channel family protein [Pseudomonadota bacterium]
MTSEKRVLLDFIGIAALCGAAIALVAYFTGDPLELPSYIGGVLNRSLMSPFQAALLAGVIAVPLHSLWVFTRYRVQVAPAYESFASWAQTLFTSFGFMGTIVGVSLAVGGLQTAMEDGEPGALIGGLSTAFDTTFLGLTGAVALMMLRRLIRLKGPQHS